MSPIPTKPTTRATPTIAGSAKMVSTPQARALSVAPAAPTPVPTPTPVPVPTPETTPTVVTGAPVAAVPTGVVDGSVPVAGAAPVAAPGVIRLGSFIAKPPADSLSRVALLLWGPAGQGKTTLAATAPKDILLINVDPDGQASITNFPAIHTIDLSGLPSMDLVKLLKNENNPAGLSEQLAAHPSVRTVILDSSTMLAEACLSEAVREGDGRGKDFVPTIEVPGISAYGGRNARLKQCLKGLLRVTARHGVNLIVTAHEAIPEKNDKGVVLYISMVLSENMVNSLAASFGEIWYLEDDGKNRRIAVRPVRLHKPMKTRMFFAESQPEFIWSFDSNKLAPESMMLSTWIDEWTANGFRKIRLPFPGDPAAAAAAATASKKE